jgi:hypothetical protein
MRSSVGAGSLALTSLSMYARRSSAAARISSGGVVRESSCRERDWKNSWSSYGMPSCSQITSEGTG